MSKDEQGKAIAVAGLPFAGGVAGGFLARGAETWVSAIAIAIALSFVGFRFIYSRRAREVQRLDDKDEREKECQAEEDRERARIVLAIRRADDPTVFGPITYYFLNVTNSSRSPVTVTHVWMAGVPEMEDTHVNDKQLPKSLQPSESWETAIHVDNVPPSSGDCFGRGRARLSDRTLLRSVRAENVPPIGRIPRGLSMTLLTPRSPP